MSEEEDNNNKLLTQNLPKLIQTPSQTHLQESMNSNLDQEEYSCKTPTSSENKIPTIQSCPPTPRKKAVQVFSHDRKRKKPDHDHEFFEATGREEVESYFTSTSNSSEISWVAVKKRCKSL
ncbi:hypothetical protein Ddye_025247 [Dipteronia dyeriana]|uniref:Uncharacterized protein n=1 Tax=Dipteronia dyeriana TaxID=168575 RepID=A0AAD9WTQ6_9ROSI|nr:hypothetical protein Ddye_025247 [Dipteronia dyeriana]